MVLLFSYSEVMWCGMAAVVVVIVFVSESTVSVMPEVSVVSIAIVEVGQVVFSL